MTGTHNDPSTIEFTPSPERPSRVRFWAVAAAAAAAAVTIGTFAVFSAGGDNSPILTSDDVARELGAAPTAPAETPAETTAPTTWPTVPEPTGTRSPLEPDGAWHLVTEDFGQLSVACQDTTPKYKVSPNPGYRLDDDRTRTANSVRFEVESDTADDWDIRVTCAGAGATPKVDATPDPDDHGRDDRDDKRDGDDDNSGRGHG
jgi:hypothetical protein